MFAETALHNCRSFSKRLQMIRELSSRLQLGEPKKTRPYLEERDEMAGSGGVKVVFAFVVLFRFSSETH